MNSPLETGEKNRPRTYSEGRRKREMRGKKENRGFFFRLLSGKGLLISIPLWLGKKGREKRNVRRRKREGEHKATGFHFFYLGKEKGEQKNFLHFIEGKEGKGKVTRNETGGG